MRLIGCSSFVAGVTGNLLPEDVAHFKKCGANAVLPKPFKMASLEELWVEYGVTAGYDQEERTNTGNGVFGFEMPFNVEASAEPVKAERCPSLS